MMAFFRVKETFEVKELKYVRFFNAQSRNSTGLFNWEYEYLKGILLKLGRWAFF